MESLFVLWRVTGQAQYREWAWAIFRAFHQHCRVESGGYANLDSVLQAHPSSLLFSPAFVLELRIIFPLWVHTPVPFVESSDWDFNLMLGPCPMLFSVHFPAEAPP